MKSIKWSGNRVRIDVVPAKPKKITGTHFASVLGINPFSTPFEVWCRCTRTYEKPFEGNQYTYAGQVIEPKVFEFLRKSMGFGDRVVTPEDIYGKDHFKKTWGDFFPQAAIFGGMWDALIYDDGKPDTVVEIKTVKVDGRSGSLEDRWKDGEAPHYQALQAALYAYLLGIDKVLMVAVALEEKNGDYEHPEQVIPSYANNNVYTDEFRISERYPNFDLYIEQATAWWNAYVLTGDSPEFDEKKDGEILKALRTNYVSANNTDIAAVVAEAETLTSEIESVLASVTEKEKRLKSLLEQIREYALNQFRDGDTKVSIPGQRFEFVLARSETTELDKDALKADGLFEKYSKPKTNYRLTKTEIKED